MKKYINPTIEVIPVEAMQALCESVGKPTNPGGHPAPKRKEKEVF